MHYFLVGVLFGLTSISGSVFSASCHEQVNSSKTQYIIGYGSLMSESSKRDTSPSVSENMPILLNGYERGLFARGFYKGKATTFLGARYKLNHNINAVMFKVDRNIIAAFDQRERHYCRYQVDTRDIELLSHRDDLTKGQVWIYLPSRSIRLKPSKEYPIYQSYIDIFLRGCLELEQKFHLTGFSKNCVIKTADWSKDLKNDRSKNTIYQNEINQLLKDIK